MRRTRLFPLLLISILITVGLFRLSYIYFRTDELDQAQGRLSLYQSTVEAELERFSHLTHVLSRDSFVQSALHKRNNTALDIRLADFARRAGLDAIYLMDRSGLTIAASNYATKVSFVGHNYAFRPYFQDALKGRQGRFYAIGSTTGEPGYFIADPVRDSDGKISGVIAIKITFSKLAASWRDTGEKVLLANQVGVVLLSSVPSWRYRVLRPLTSQQRQKIETARQFAGQPLAPLNWSSGQNNSAQVDGERYMHLTATTPGQGWELHYFSRDDRAVTRSGLVTAVAAVAAGLGVGYLQLRRTRRIRRALDRSENEESNLRAANARLAHEIAERHTAERQLKRTQDELERAGRLAALGQVSASVTHELGQPIAAMRNHLAAAQMSSPPAGAVVPLIANIDALVDRMEGITRQLKFFARSGRQEFEAINLTQALRTALELVAPNLSQIAVDIQCDDLPKTAPIRGSRLRVEQVITNLLRNAADAIEDVDAPQITLRIHQHLDQVALDISDNGHGLGAATLADLEEPFVTTRESGRGMGLGLAISAQIIKEHGGQMSARNNATGGATFRVTFPAASSDPSEAI